MKGIILCACVAVIAGLLLVGRPGFVEACGCPTCLVAFGPISGTDSGRIVGFPQMQ